MLNVFFFRLHLISLTFGLDHLKFVSVSMMNIIYCAFCYSILCAINLNCNDDLAFHNAIKKSMLLLTGFKITTTKKTTTFISVRVLLL